MTIGGGSNACGLGSEFNIGSRGTSAIGIRPLRARYAITRWEGARGWDSDPVGLVGLMDTIELNDNEFR